MGAMTTDGHNWATAIETAAGILLTLFILLDVFLTVLYARIGYGIFSRQIARSVWAVFAVIGKSSPRHRGRILSFCGPAIVVALIVTWSICLSVGSALIVHPRLGTTFVATQGVTETDFGTALLEGNASLSIFSSTTIKPVTLLLRIFYVFNALAGATVLSLTLTYLMQVYSALHHRNTFALKLHVSGGGHPDAAEVIAGLGPRGRFELGTNVLEEFMGEIAQVKETHHLYPVLYYFRFPATLYSVPQFVFVVLDTVALIRTALHSDYDWLKELGSIQALHQASTLLVKTLTENFAKSYDRRPDHPAEQRARDRWTFRYHGAIQRLRAAGIKTRDDVNVGAQAYVAERNQWAHYVTALANQMQHSVDELEQA